MKRTTLRLVTYRLHNERKKRRIGWYQICRVFKDLSRIDDRSHLPVLRFRTCIVFLGGAPILESLEDSKDVDSLRASALSPGETSDSPLALAFPSSAENMLRGLMADRIGAGLVKADAADKTARKARRRRTMVLVYDAK